MEIETVQEHCKHPDCRYRQNLSNIHTPYCAYIIYEGVSRKCPISQCDKYKPGKLKIGLDGETIEVK